MTKQFLALFLFASLLGAVAAYLGSLMLTRRMSLVGDALGHIALPGLGLALTLHFDASLGAFSFLLLGILLIWYLEQKTLIGTETLVGIVFVTSLAIGFLIVPEPELLESLIGEVSKVSLEAAMISILILVALFFVIKRIYLGLLLANISEDLAQVQGVSLSKYNLIYLLAIGVLVSLGVKIAGTLLVGALLIVPAASARNLNKDLKHYIFQSILIGASTCGLGIIIYKLSHFPAGPSIILVNSFFFGISLLLKKISNG